MLPNFLIAGAHKSASTSLINYLSKSPDISCITTLNDGNEVNFFSKNKRYKKGLHWYEGLFANLEKKKAVGEKSVAYMSSKCAPQRIAKDLPDVKLIFILRNPVDRAYSHYSYNLQKGTELFSFEKALEIEAKRIKRGGFFYNNYSYKDRSLYYYHVMEYKKHFSMEQMYFVLMEDFQRDPEVEMEKLCRFLGIGKGFVSRIDYGERYNQTKVPRLKPLQFILVMTRKIIKLKSVMSLIDKLIEKNSKYVEREPMAKETRRQLLAYFKVPNEKLSQQIGKDLTIWDN
jgi:hypothetical protein